MSIERLKNLFNALPTCEAWSIQLLKINTSNHMTTTYIGREITLTPIGQLNTFVREISEKYARSISHKFTEVRDYDSSALSQTIYKLPVTSELIANEYQAMLDGIAQPNAEFGLLDFKWQAYLLNGLVKLGDESFPVKLIFIKNPITTLKHKFMASEGAFKEISDKVLSLKTTIDVIIFDESIYMLTLDGEKLFNMERSYKAVCTTKISEVQECNIVTDFEAFRRVAACGHNPRKFVSFNNAHLEKFKKSANRRKIAQKFKISLEGDKFDTSKDQTVDKLIKILCNRGMIDPFGDNPVEVAGSKKWE